MTEFSFINAFAGGIMIGIATVLMFLFNGRITGISGIIGGLLKPVPGQVSWRMIFLLSLIVGGAIYPMLWGRDLPVELNGSTGIYILAGLLVGIGTRMGSGCTSGHGICGIARLSPRSLMATATFIVCAMITHSIAGRIFG